MRVKVGFDGFVEYKDHMGSDADIVDAARVSYKGNGKSTDRDLIRYLIRNKHCYHPDMEVLTMRGWIKWKDCNSSELFVVPNPISGDFTVEELKVNIFDYNGELICSKNDRMSFKVTPNHDMWFKQKYSKTFSKVKASEMSNWGHFDTIDNYKLFDKNTVPDSEFMFIGFYLGDGAYTSKNRLVFHLKKERKRVYLLKLLDVLKLKYKVQPSKSREGAFLYTIVTPNFLKDFLGDNLPNRSVNKGFDITKLSELTDEQVLGLWDGLNNSDGSIKKDRKQLEFSSRSINLVKIYEAISSFIGIDCHKVSSKEGMNNVKSYYGDKTTLESRKQHRYKENYIGKVYCTTTSTGLLMVRGDDTKFAFVCGNSSPTEMGIMKFHVRLPLYVVQQILRHRLFSINQISYRYTKIDDVMEKTEPDKWRLQSKDNKQGSDGYLEENPETDGGLYFSVAEEKFHEESKKLYNDRITSGIAREQARKDIPVSTYTEFYWMGNVRTIFNFLSLRCDYHAQQEVREFANVIAGFVKLHFPLAFEAWEDYDFYASTLTRLDKDLIKQILKRASTYQLLEENIFSKECWGQDVSEEMRIEVGMTKREFNEFWDKFDYNRQNFDLEKTCE